MNLPESYIAYIKDMLGDEAGDYFSSLDRPPCHSLRVNKLKIQPENAEDILPFNLRKIPWIDGGYYYGDTDRPALHPYYYAGLYYLQEASAMTPADILPVKEGDMVLDLCAAPGGKSTQIIQRIGDKGILISNDISSSRAKALLKNIELTGADCPVVTCEEPKNLARYFPGKFDCILVDAPCSGEGMFRKKSNMASYWEMKDPKYYSRIQRDILRDAYYMLRPGGYMVYSTCTFNTLENEGSVEYLLDEYPDMTVERPKWYKGFHAGYSSKERPELRYCIRIFPHMMEGEGHFVSLLRKKCGCEKVAQSFDSGKFGYVRVERLPMEAVDFLKSCRYNIQDKSFYLKGDGLFAVKKEYSDKLSPDIHYLRCGSFLGYIKKKRFEPSTAFAVSLKPENYPYVVSYKSDDMRSLKYLKGETLTSDDTEHIPSGSMVLVCVDGYPVGWAKKTLTLLKNKYNPSWRWL